MSYLQTKHNLADLKSVCEAQHNLKIRSMGLQDKSNVQIYDGNISVSSLKLNANNVDSNYVIVSKDDTGEFEWKRLSFAEWMQKDPSDILLSSFSNDMDIMSGPELNSKIEEYIESIKDTLINSNLNVEVVSLCNIVYRVDSDIHNIPCVLTNNGQGSNIQLVALEQTYTNSNSTNSNLICSAKVVNDLYNYTADIEERLPTLGESYLTSDLNLSDVNNPITCQENLGIRDSFQCSNLKIQNVEFLKPTTVQTTAFDEEKEYYLKKNIFNQLVYKEDKIINNFLEASSVYPPTASALNDLYHDMLDRISVFLEKSNVLSEITEDEELRGVFKTRLIETGLCNLSFTADWVDVDNKPTSLSAFSNDLQFISSYNNLSEIKNGHSALRNLGISEVGISGNFADMNLPTAISNIITLDDVLGAIEGVPFLRKDLYLDEISNNAGRVRSNLGINDMALFDQYNVEIRDGDITVTNCDVTSKLIYRLSNVYMNNAAYSSNYFLRANHVSGEAVWDTFPVADPNTNKIGITYLTNDILTNASSNVALTPYSLSNVFYDNDLLVQLVPIAENNIYGLIRISDDYTNAQDNTVITTRGISNMFTYFTEGNGTFDRALLEQKIELLDTISNLDNTFERNLESNVQLITTYFEGNDSINGPGLGIPNEGINSMIGDRVKIIESTTPSILVVTEKYEDYTKNGVQFSSSNKKIEIGLQLPMTSEPNKFLSTNGTFEDVVFYHLKKQDTGEAISNSDVVFEGTLLDFNTDTSTISFANPNGTMFEYEYSETQTNKQLNVKGGLIGDKNSIYTTTNSNYYFKYFANDTYGFDNILNDIPIFAGTGNGLVNNSTLDNDIKENHYLNANGDWVNRSEIMDRSEIEKLSMTHIDIRDDADNILDFSVIAGTCNVEIGMKGVSEYNWLVTKDETNTKFIWKNPFQVLIDWSSAEYNAGTRYEFSDQFSSDKGFKDIFTGEPGARNPRDYYIDGSGRFVKNQNFSTRMTLTGCNIETIQDFNSIESTYGLSGFSNTITLSYSNIYGINTHYINRSDILHTEILRETNGNGIDLYFYETYGEEDKYNEPNKLIVEFDDMHRLVPSIDTMVSYVTEKASGLSKTDVNDVDFDTQTITLNKMVIGHSLSNYIRNHIVFDYTIDNDVYDHSSINAITNYLYQNRNQFVKGGNLIELYDSMKFEYMYEYSEIERNQFKQTFVTPQSLSNWVYEKIENKFTNIVSTNIEFDFDEQYANKVVSGISLSNYVRNQLTYHDTNFTDTNPDSIQSDKFVLRSNLRHYVAKHKYIYTGLNNEFNNNDTNYVTPSIVKRYLDDSGLSASALTNILSGFTIDDDVDLLDIDPTMSNYIVTLGSLSNFMFNKLAYDNYNNTTFESTNNQFVSSSNVAVYTKELIETYKNTVLVSIYKDSSDFYIPNEYNTDFVTFDNFYSMVFNTLYFVYDVDKIHTDDISYISPQTMYKYLNFNTYNYDSANFDKSSTEFIYNGIDTGINLTTVTDVISLIQNDLRFTYDFDDFKQDQVSMITPRDVDDHLLENIYVYNTNNFVEGQNFVLFTSGIDKYFNLITLETLSNILQNELRYVYDLDTISTQNTTFMTPTQTYQYIDHHWNTKTFIYDPNNDDDDTLATVSDQFISPAVMVDYLFNNMDTMLFNSTLTYPDSLNPLIMENNQTAIITLETLSNILFEQLNINDTVESERFNMSSYYNEVTNTQFIPLQVNFFRFYYDTYNRVYLEQNTDEARTAYNDIIASRNNKLITYESHNIALLDMYRFLKFNDDHHIEIDTGGGLDPYDLSQPYDIQTYAGSKYIDSFLTAFDLQNFMHFNFDKTFYSDVNFDTYQYRETTNGVYITPFIHTNSIDTNQIITVDTMTGYIDDYFKIWALDHILTSETNDVYQFHPSDYPDFMNSNDDRTINVGNSIPTLDVVKLNTLKTIEDYDYSDVLRNNNIFVDVDGFAIALGGPGLIYSNGLTCGKFNNEDTIYKRIVDSLDVEVVIEMADYILNGTNKLFQVGMGTNNINRVNALEVLDNGDLYVRGSIILNDGKWRIRTDFLGNELVLEKGSVSDDGQQFVYTTKHTFI